MYKVENDFLTNYWKEISINVWIPKDKGYLPSDMWQVTHLWSRVPGVPGLAPAPAPGLLYIGVRTLPVPLLCLRQQSDDIMEWVKIVR